MLGLVCTYTVIFISLISDAKTAPVFETSKYSVFIAEDIMVNTAFLQTQALSLNSTTFQEYTLVAGNTDGAFFINETTGIVYINQTVDREEVDYYSLTVKFTDDNGSAYAQVEVYVEDVNDNFPLFSQIKYVYTIPENLTTGSVIGTVNATDADIDENGQITYELICSYECAFIIDSVTGKISTEQEFDYETVNQYSLQVSASDLGIVQRLTTNVTVQIDVTDINDNSPVFSSELYEIQVKESVPPGTRVGMIYAYDSDSFSNAQLSFMLLKTSNSKPVLIDKSTGVLTTNIIFDYETNSSYSLKVVVTDSGHPALSATADIIITVIDILIECPVFLQASFSSYLSYDRLNPPAVGSVILNIEATNSDNKSAEYEIVSGNDDSIFFLNIENGNFSLLKNDDSVIGQHNLQVSASNSSCLSEKLATVQVTIVSVPPAIVITVNKNEFRTPENENGKSYYIFDPLQGSPNNLTVDCKFVGNSSEIEVLQNNSFWNVTFKNSSLNAMVQGGSKFTDAIFTLPTPSGFVNVSFFSNHQSTFVSFNPGFNDGLSGTFYCHSTADFSVISPVSVTISPENPLFFLNNLTSLNLVYPISTFNLPGLYAEYRYNGLQMIAETELIVYYLDGSILVNGSIELSDVDSRTYKIEFPGTLIPVAEITLVLNLKSQLGTSKSLTIVVNSHGLKVLPSTPVKVLVGSNITLQCISLVPGISTEWYSEVKSVKNSSLTLTNVMESSMNRFNCQTLDTSTFPAEGESTVLVELLVLPEPVSIRRPGELVFFPQPSFLNGALELIITCSSLPGNGNLTLTLDSPYLPSNLSQSSEFHSLHSDSPNELTLEVFLIPDYYHKGKVTCISNESGQSAEVNGGFARNYISVLEYPLEPLTVGREAVITFLVASNADGYNNTGVFEFDISVTSGTNTFEIPSSLIEVSSFNVFTYQMIFNVTSLLNGTVTVILSDDIFNDNASVSISLFIKELPEVTVISEGSFIYSTVARRTITLQCSTTDNETVIEWHDSDSLLLPPHFNASQSLDGVSGLDLIPFIYDIRYSLYPPLSLGLSDIGVVDTYSWTEIPGLINITCGVCDDTDFSGYCEYAELIGDTILLEAQYHDVTWRNEKINLYDGSVVNSNLDNSVLHCQSTSDNGDLGLRTENLLVNEYFQNGSFNNPLLLSESTSIHVSSVSHHLITLTIIGIFTESMSGEYTCYSKESGASSTVFLTSDVYYIELLVPSLLTHTLGTSVFIPYRSAINTTGSPGHSRSTSDQLVVTSPPGTKLNNYEVSPYNFGLYIPTLTSEHEGNYFINLSDHKEVQKHLTVEYPSIFVPKENVTVREGDSVRLSCEPSNSLVQLVWSTSSPSSTNSSFFDLSSFSFEYESELQHSVTIFNINTSTTFYCYVKGDQANKKVPPGKVSVTVTPKPVCKESLMAGVLYKESFEESIVTLSCSELSERFIDSIFVSFSRECTGTGWLVPQFSTCTLSKSTTNAFALIDIILVANSTSTVMQNESRILKEVQGNLLADEEIAELAVKNYIKFDVGIGIVMEALLTSNIKFTEMLSDDKFHDYSESSIDGFPLIKERHFFPFQPADPCKCSPLSSARKNNDSLSFFSSLCVGILAEPCQCTDGGESCKCQNPFVGTGRLCTIDSDSDQYPDNAIESEEACNQTVVNGPKYCINDTCPDVYNPNQSPKFCNTTGNMSSLMIKGCSAEVDEEYGIKWPFTPVNNTATQACGNGNVLGLATRFCDASGEWLSINESECQSRIFKEISILSDIYFTEDPAVLNTSELEYTTESSGNVIKKLSLATSVSVTQSVSLFPTELSISNEALSGTISILVENIKRNVSNLNVFEEDFTKSFSNLLDSNNEVGWQNLQQDNPSMGSELLLDNAEDFGFLLALSVAENQQVVISEQNIVIQAKNIHVQLGATFSSISFPSSSDIANFSNHNSSGASIVISSTLLEERSIGRKSLPIANILFNNLQDFIKGTNASSPTVNPGSLIISSQVGGQSGSEEVSHSLQNNQSIITFEILEDNFSDPTCVFWQFSNPIGTGRWSTSGVETVYIEGMTSVTCLSQHLTSFAVLVDTREITQKLPDKERVALSVVTYFGLSISVVALLLTAAFFLTFGKMLFTSVHYFVHLNLALSLLLGYVVFICGIDIAVGNKVGCTLVAALLHYFFLSAFCWMLCEGIMLYLMLVVVFSSLSKKWWLFLLIGWLSPLLPIVVSVGVAHDYYTSGEDFCWLSVKDNVIWSFIVPMIVIILVNIVLYVVVIITLVKNKSARNSLKVEHKKRIDLVIATLKGSIILLPLLGLTWVFGLLAVNQQTSFFAWMFTIFNALQGAAFFVLHVIRNDKVWDWILMKYNRCMGYEKSNTQSSSLPVKKNLHKFVKKVTSLHYSKPSPMEDTAFNIQLLEKSTQTGQIEEHDIVIEDESSITFEKMLENVRNSQIFGFEEFFQEDLFAQDCYN